jgi:hypothetical protein
MTDMVRGFTFNTAKVMTFNEAAQKHAQLQEMLQNLKDRTRSDFAARKLIASFIADAWNECMGVGDPNSELASVIRTRLPLELVPLLQAYSGIPAATFVCILVETALHDLEHKNDISRIADKERIVKATIKLFDVFRNNVASLASNFGWGLGVCWAHARKLINDRSGAIKPTMAKIAHLAGRMYKAFDYNGLRSKTRDPEEIEGVETGGELERMLPEEAASLGIDPEALVRFAEGQSAQYEMSGLAPKSRGPLVLVIDESGSMSGPRIEWAKACAVALTRIALEEGRAVRVVHFATGTHVQEIRPNEPSDVIELAETFLNGGTEIGMAIEVAVEQVGELEKLDLVGADIVFTTDGTGNYSEKWFKIMHERGIQLWTIAIDVDIKKIHEQFTKTRGGYQLPGYLYSYATAYVHIDEKTIRDGANSQGAIDLAVKLKGSALDNGSRDQEETTV